MDFRLDLLKDTVAWAEKLEDNGVKATIRLDDKAQQTGVVAGAFLAGAFGFLKPQSLVLAGKVTTYLADALLLMIVVDLVMCAGACLSVSWLQYTPTPIALPVAKKMVGDLLGLPEAELTDDLKEDFYWERITLWSTIIDDRIELNKLKAKRLGLAQKLLAASFFLISTLLLIVIGSMILAKIRS